MRIIGFSWEYPRIGLQLTDLQYLVLSLSSVLRALGHDVTIVVPGNANPPNYSGVKVIGINIPIKDYPNVVSYGLSSSMQVVANMRYSVDGKFDEIVCFEWGGCIMGLLAKSTQPCCMGSSINCVVLSTEYERGDPWNDIMASSIASIEGWIFRQCDGVYAVRQGTVDNLKNKYNVKATYVPSIEELGRVIAG